MRTAVIGTGLMGAPLARRLLACGHEVHVYNRTPERAAALAEDGATVATSATEAVAAADWVVTMVANADALRATLLDDPEARAALAGRRVVNMATIGPDQARAIGAEVEAAGGEFMECPVLGSIPEAKAGTLILMFGGTSAQAEAAGPLLAAFGEDLRHVGPVGSAAALKLAMNQLIASLTSAFAFALSYTEAEGVDPAMFMGVLRDSALYAPTFDKKVGRMQEGRFGDPNFPVAHLLKDVRLMRAAATEQGIDPALLAPVEQALAATAEAGHAEDDYSALITAYRPG
ncbi:3-hydroxyisobutyrate dehydrogenase [Thiohalospira halophila DSM 15071]|uniref:3-hydroxyisobutyrate dehydrogenase n=1 Tax=Thiohalospira halophila DSM 15071 TaxID=1123397 RepID=A0A1I1VYY1_9GAMM|nr:NAD(P)-dependent oxidoreductase [Thiohalospira halophila]SFD87969.1 3-hydroxyisobutyrate dehydrogenase [Thiohalospira halophila DSM 15071]